MDRAEIRYTQLSVGCSRKVTLDYQSREYHAGASIDVPEGGDIAELAAAAYQQLREIIEHEHERDNTMAVLPKATEHEPMTEGEHILKLKDARIERINTTFPDGKGDGKAPALVLDFVSKTTNDDGVPEELRLILPPAISSRNKTGKIARMLCPGLDPDTDEFDPDDYIGKVYTAIITHETTASGRVRAWPAVMKPFKKSATNGTNGAEPKPKPKPKPDPDPALDPDDPFAD